MKTIIAVLMLISYAFQAHAGDIKCQVDNITAENSEKDVLVAVIGGNQIANAKEVSFQGSKVSATFRKGDRYEGQSQLQMQLDDIVSSIRNVSEASGYELDKGDIRFQCWFEK